MSPEKSREQRAESPAVTVEPVQYTARQTVRVATTPRLPRPYLVGAGADAYRLALESAAKAGVPSDAVVRDATSWGQECAVLEFSWPVAAERVQR